MRALVLRRGFREALPGLAPRGSRAWESLRDVLRELTDERVPLVRPDDRSVALPMAVIGRPVPGTDLLIVYVPGVDEVAVVALRKA